MEKSLYENLEFVENLDALRILCNQYFSPKINPTPAEYSRNPNQSRDLKRRITTLLEQLNSEVEKSGNLLIF